MTKHIAIFSIHSDPLARLGGRENGGQNLYVRSLIQELDRLGWTVDCFTRFNDSDKRDCAHVGKRSRVMRIRGGPAHHIPKGKLHPYFPELWNNFLAFLRREYGGQNPYVLFHGHHYDGGVIALDAHRIFGNPLVMTYHSLGIVRLHTHQKYLGKIDDEREFLERLDMEQKLVKQSSLIIATSESEKQDLVNYYGANPETVSIVPGGINLAQFEPIPKEKARDTTRFDRNDYLLLFVGRLEWRKGVATLLHALRIVSKEIPNAKLAVVGGKIFGKKANGDDMKEYNRLAMIAEKIGVADRVRFTGAVSHGYLKKFYSSADVLIVPSYYESFGLVPLEGFSCGVPVIASRTGGLMNTIQDGQNGLLFEPRNPPGLAEKILALYRSPDLARLLAQTARESVKQYSWRRIGEQIAGLYASILIEPSVGVVEYLPQNEPFVP